MVSYLPEQWISVERQLPERAGRYQVLWRSLVGGKVWQDSGYAFWEPCEGGGGRWQPDHDGRPEARTNQPDTAPTTLTEEPHVAYWK